jgi:hypothetical protein
VSRQTRPQNLNFVTSSGFRGAGSKMNWRSLLILEAQEKTFSLEYKITITPRDQSLTIVHRHISLEQKKEKESAQKTGSKISLSRASKKLVNPDIHRHRFSAQAKIAKAIIFFSLD